MCSDLHLSGLNKVGMQELHFDFLQTIVKEKTMNPVRGMPMSMRMVHAQKSLKQTNLDNQFPELLIPGPMHRCRNMSRLYSSRERDQLMIRVI